MNRQLLAAVLVVTAIGLAFWTTMKGAPQKPATPEQAIGSLDDLDQTWRRLLDTSGFDPLPKPGPNDWLANHPEPGQTFDQFQSGGFNKPDAKRRVIYLQPIGDLSVGETGISMETLQEFTTAFFGLPVKVRPTMGTDVMSKLKSRRHPQSGGFQLLSTDILDLLEKHLPDDAYCMLGLTLLDLYPEDSWNFVFGQANLFERVGVFSFARYDPAFYTGERPEGYKKLIMRRALKVLSHETGHMFGLLHCIHFECGMNGSNHLAESDSRPIHLCPLCLRKLLSATGQDPVKRYQQLSELYEKAGMSEEAEWVKKRLKHISR
jgi:archaemetzincin